MITEKTILSGTEEELLAYFIKKYNLVKYEYVGDCEQEQPEQEASSSNPDPHQGINLPNKAAPVGGNASTGLNNLFGGTTWGN